MIDGQLTALAREALAIARKKGATKARASLVLSTEDIINTRDGKIDRITRCEDRSLSLTLLVDSRRGEFSVNRLDRDSVEKAITEAIDVIRYVAKDECRDLPDPERLCTDAVTGRELGLFDESYFKITQQERIDRALDVNKGIDENHTVLSEEGEYSDSVCESMTIDTNGLECFHSETSFDYWTEITIDADGRRYSGYGWDSSPFKDGLSPISCRQEALARAVAQIGARPVRSRRCKLVLDREISYKAVSPVLGALNALSIQQQRSFLTGSLGKKLFPEGLTLIDDPRRIGESGSCLFDSEGVGVDSAPIIENGVVKMYFVNTYTSKLMGLSPTRSSAIRPLLQPWPRKGLDKDAIFKMCGSGIYVTDINGGNCNPVTGDFSYGIEGFTFKDGKIGKPVSEMLMSGNILKLWEGFIASGEDCRPCMSKLIPTLAFSNVDFSG